MLAELITSIASGMIVRMSGLIADRNRSYGWTTIETPPSFWISRIVSSPDSPLRIGLGIPRPIMCPSRLDISMPGMMRVSSSVSVASMLWSVIASPSRPALRMFGTSSSSRVYASLDLLVWTCRSSFNFRCCSAPDLFQPCAEFLGRNFVE